MSCRAWLCSLEATEAPGCPESTLQMAASNVMAMACLLMLLRTDVPDCQVASCTRVKVTHTLDSVLHEPRCTIRVFVLLVATQPKAHRFWPLSPQQGSCLAEHACAACKARWAPCSMMVSIQHTDHSLVVCLQLGQRNGYPEGPHRCHCTTLWGHCRAVRCLPWMGPKSPVASASGGQAAPSCLPLIVLCATDCTRRHLLLLMWADLLCMWSADFAAQPSRLLLLSRHFSRHLMKPAAQMGMPGVEDNPHCSMLCTGFAARVCCLTKPGAQWRYLCKQSAVSSATS